jgi:arylsulfatase A-like enzyme
MQFNKYIEMKFALLILIAVAFCYTGYAQQKVKDKPNIIFIIADDLNDCVEGLGGHPQAKTPNMDRLAKQGVRFTNAHCNYPMCSQSRASMMAGLYPSTTGAFGFTQAAKFRENPGLKSSVTLIEHLANNGYLVFGTGKIFHGDGSEWNRKNMKFGVHHDFGPWPWNGVHPPKGKYYQKLQHPGLPKELNWDAAFGPLSDIPEYKPDSIRNIPGYKGWFMRGKPFKYVSDDDRDLMSDELSAQWAKSVLREDHKKPFFLGVGFVRTHSPLYAPKKYFDMFPLDEIVLPPYKENDLEDCAEILWNVKREKRAGGAATLYGHEKCQIYKDAGLWKKWIQAYLACVAYLDDQVGVVLDALEESPYKDNTIIILTSDHGFHMGEKDWIFKHTVWEEATRVPFIVVDPRNRNRGMECKQAISLIDIYPSVVDFCGLPKEPNKSGNGIPLDGFSIKPLVDDPKNGNWDGPSVALIALAPNETHMSKSIMGEVDRQHYAVRSERWRYVLCNNGEEELYDHKNDPNEWTNLASDIKYRGVKNKLKDELLFLTKRNGE